MTKRTGANDVYQIVADQILTALEAGRIPWRKPWSASGMVPQNFVSKRPYNGVNVILTGMQGYACPYWATFKQIKEKGGSVRKGEKGTTVVFWKILNKTVTDEDTGEDKIKKIFFLRYYKVFNIEQTEGIEWTKPEPKNAGEPIPACEAIVAGYKNGPSLNHGQSAAYYRPDADSVGMPDLEMFDSEPHYYSTLFHELVHSTGHKKRCDRFKDKSVSFGSDSYSREELVAEIGSAFLACETGIDSEEIFDNSIAYLQGWRDKIKDDPRCVVIAAGQAQKAVDHIKGEEHYNGDDHD